MKSRHSETGGDFLYYKKWGRQVVAGKRQTGSYGAVAGGGVKGEWGRMGAGEVRQALPDGAV